MITLNFATKKTHELIIIMLHYFHEKFGDENISTAVILLQEEHLLIIGDRNVHQIVVTCPRNSVRNMALLSSRVQTRQEI